MKILLVGLGAVGQRHARNLRQILGAEADLLVYRTQRQTPFLTDTLTLAGETNPETALQLKSFSTLDEALAQKPQAVIVANPTSLHLETSLRAAAAGCHLFIEKPVAHSLDQTADLLRLTREKKLLTLIGYQWRFHPLLRRVRMLLQENQIGDLISARATYGEYLPDWHPYEDYRKSYAARRDLGGGVLLTQIHDFDYLGWLLGWPERVCSFGGQLGGLEIDVEDTASTLLSCPGPQGSIPVHLHQDLVQKPGCRSFEIIGRKGKIMGNLLTGHLSLPDRQGKISEKNHAPVTRNEIFLEAMKHFVDCLRSGKETLVPLEEGLKSLRVALAAKESMEKNQVVEIPSYEA